MQSIQEQVLQYAKAARKASCSLANLPTDQKDKALLAMARILRTHQDDILAENKIDLKRAKRANLPASLIDRLQLTEKRMQAMADSLREITELPDPIGETIFEITRPNGLRICKLRVPLGVVGIIYESRPNVTAEATGLCLKAGNAVILRGGSEAINSNLKICELLCEAAKNKGIPPGSIQLIPVTDRQAVGELLRMDRYIDVIIPRGGETLIKVVKENATIPVIFHGKGVCHTYVDKKADLEKAKKICFNAKCQRPGVCNAMETLLVHQEIVKQFLPAMLKSFIESGVEIRGDKKVQKIMPRIKLASEEDWSTEYLELILSVKVVNNLGEAITHINKYGSHHSDAIVTEDKATADKFLKAVDSADVYWNASTRFTDGGEFGMGAEIGISTQKLHARGPMGLKELTSTKFIVYGDGQIRK